MRRRILRPLIWVYTVCSGLSVRIHTVNTVYVLDSRANIMLIGGKKKEHVRFNVSMKPQEIIRSRQHSICFIF